MSRVLLLGAGPLPHPGMRHVAFPQLRTAHFAHALGANDLGLVCLRGAGDGEPPSETGGPAKRVWDVAAERGDWIERVRAIARQWKPDVWVTAGPYLPMRAAAAAVGDEPLWVDVPGDPFAEAQARAARLAPGKSAEPLPADPGGAQAVAYSAALERGDAFSVCSASQLMALHGQLGVVGRLAVSDPSRRWGEVIPPAFDFGIPSRAPRPRPPDSPLTVLLAGGFNTWLDETCILQGLTLAMDRGLPLRVIVTGGDIPGHFEGGWAGFASGARASVHSDRFDLLGWVPQAQLAELTARADLLLLVDRPGAEPLLGSRTRLLFGLHQGLEVAATTGCDLARDLCERGFLRPIQAAQPSAVADLLADAVAAGTDGQVVAQAQASLAERLHPDVVAAPLQRWVENPGRAPTGSGASQEVLRQLEATRAELEAVYATPTWRLLSTLHGLVKRLTGSS